MFCELLQEELTTEECTKCWQDQMEELAKEFEEHSLLLTGGPICTITHAECKRENILKGAKQ